MAGLIVQEWIEETGGAEQVLDAMRLALPDSRVACLWNDDPARFPPDAVDESWLARTPLPLHAYAVIVTRGHTNDLEALRALAPHELRYLGLIGSRAKVARIFDALRADQMPAAHLDRVHAPIGLDIGAVTPQEIAVSILAELIAVKHGKISGGDATAALSMKWDGWDR